MFRQCSVSVLYLTLLFIGFYHHCESEFVPVKPEPRLDETDATKLPKTNYQSLCVSLTPEFVSSRDGEFVTFECLASVCADNLYDVMKDDDEQDKSKDDNNLLVEQQNDITNVKVSSMKHPMFDWNTELYHLLTTNGKCDANLKNCWSRIEINIQDLLKEMKEDTLEELQIECVVADLITNQTETSDSTYLYGKAISTLKNFKGKKIHAACEEDQECGENMICLKQQQQDGANQDTKTVQGYCECIPITSTNESESTENSLVLLTDKFYDEQVCLPVREFNQTCLYDQQCKINDLSLECMFRQELKAQDTFEKGLPEDLLIKFCLCQSNYYWSGGMCIEKTSFIESEENSKPVQTGDNNNANSRNSVWWIIGTYDDSNAVEKHQQLPYFSMVQFFTGLLFLIPITIIIFTIYLTCRSKCCRNSSKWNGRTFGPQQPSNLNFYRSKHPTDESYYYGEVKSDKAAGLPKISEMKIIKAYQSKKKEDKQDLIDGDQLDHRNQV